MGVYHMAIYHLSLQSISRGNNGPKAAKKGKSTVAMSAYRAGEKILDERTGLVYDYTDKKGVEYTEILAPEDAPDWVHDRAALWNNVERIEKRANSQLGKEINLALAKEMSKEQNIELLKKFCNDTFVKEGIIADIAYHDKADGNPHAHIMLTRREINRDGFGAIRKEWFGGEFKGFTGKEQEEYTIKLRESWANYLNEALELAEVQEQVSHKSLKDQEIDRIPQIHLGPNVHAMQEKGIETDRGRLYEIIEEANKVIGLLKERQQELEKQKEGHAIEQDSETCRKSILKDYPPELRFLSYEEALELSNLKTDGTQVDYNDILRAYANKNRDISIAKMEINRITERGKELEQAKDILEKYEARKKTYDYYSKGGLIKLWRSITGFYKRHERAIDESKREYEYSCRWMMQAGIEDRADYEEQKEKYDNGLLLKLHLRKIEVCSMQQEAEQIKGIANAIQNSIAKHQHEHDKQIQNKLVRQIERQKEKDLERSRGR